MDRGGAREDGIHEEKMGFMKRRWDYEEKMGFMKEIEEGPEVGEWERLRRWMGREC